MSEPWQYLAACAEADTDTMYPDDDKGIRKAKRICGTCPVASDCLTAAQQIHEPWGIWGGFTAVERERLRNGTEARRCDCGIWFVGRYVHQRRCSDCSAKVHRGGSGRSKTAKSRSPLEVYADDIAALIRAGWTDGQVAAMYDVSRESVCLARKRWGVAVGSTDANPVDAGRVNAAADGVVEFRDLNRAERIELWRRFEVSGMALSAFATRFRASYRTVRAIKEAADRLAVAELS